MNPVRHPVNDRTRLSAVHAYQSYDRNVLITPPLDILLPLLAAKRPVSAVNEETFVVLQSRDIGPLPAAEDADTHEKKVALVLEFLKLAFTSCRGSLDAHVPFSSRLVVAGIGELVTELDVGRESVFADDALEMLQDLGARGV